ncbi:unnamed protein product [Schistocephalus solidus]|uniref:C2H2-type domain-containing protein n=1 Tax=Schistocephalus solidus TaxID=70667 RepID=A0A183TB44_SCHSO|nr:unnamed protein product [Schistocephalus solidus]
MPTLSMHLPRAKQSGPTPSVAMQQQSYNFNFCVNLCQPPSEPPTVTPGTSSPTPTIIGTTSHYSPPDTYNTTSTTDTVTTTTPSDADLVLTCPHCDRSSTSRISLVVHLRIHLTEIGEPLPGAPTYSRDRRIPCPNAFTHHGRIRSHAHPDSGIHCNVDSTDTQHTLSAPAILTTTATATTTNDNHPTPPDFSYPHCARNFTSRIGLIGHL